MGEVEWTDIVIGLPMTTATFDWRVREAKPHTWKQVPEDVFTHACETLNQIVAIG